MSDTAISIQGNIDEVVTTITEDITAGEDDVDVFESDNFANGDTIVITDLSPGGKSETQVINGAPSSDNIQIEGAFGNSYLMENGVRISTYQTLNYTYDSANLRINRSKDGGAMATLVGKVSSLTFTYLDENGNVTAVTTEVRRMDIQLTMTDTQGNSTVSVDFNTNINLRNMS